MFFKIDVLENSANFTGKHLCWSLFVIKLQAIRPTTLLKRDSNTGDILWDLQKFLEYPLLKNTFFIVTARVYSESLGKILVQNNQQIPCWQTTILTRTLLQKQVQDVWFFEETKM